jgi:hypothetical protein
MAESSDSDFDDHPSFKQSSSISPFPIYNRYLNNIPLYIVYKRISKSHLIAYIKIPNTYTSKFSEKLKEMWPKLYGGFTENLKEPVFGFIEFKGDTGEEYSNLFKNSDVDFKIKKKEIIYIERFYLFSNYKDFPKFVNEEEKKVFKGIGKELFCSAINYIYDNNILDLKNLNKPKSTLVLLYAESPSCDLENFNMPLDDMILLLFKRYKIDLKNYLESGRPSKVYSIPPYDNFNEKENKELKKILCNIISNKKLIEYYKKEYNFKVIFPQQGYDTWMYSELEDVISKCKEIVKN